MSNTAPKFSNGVTPIESMWENLRGDTPDSDETVAEIKLSFDGYVAERNLGRDQRIEKIRARIGSIDHLIGLRKIDIPMTYQDQTFLQEWSNSTTEDLIFEQEILIEILVREEATGDTRQQG